MTLIFWLLVLALAAIAVSFVLLVFALLKLIRGGV